MVRFCPHDLFVNTRSDLGICPRIHDQKLKESFEESPRHDAYVLKFEAELAQFCEKLVLDLDRKVRRGRERLAQEVEVTPTAPASTEKSEHLSVLEEKIKKLLEQVESLGEAGKVDEAEALMRKVDILNAEKTAFTHVHQTQNDKLMMLTQEKKMALCEICGSFLVANDAAERTQSHVLGKQHIGYGMVWDFISEHKAIPGMLLALVLCFDHRRSKDSMHPLDLSSSREKKYIWYAVSGYAIGLVAALAAGILTQSPQPALLYLVPSTLGPVMFISWTRKEFMELWEGIEEMNDKTHVEESNGIAVS